jgi:hypothetical protein
VRGVVACPGGTVQQYTSEIVDRLVAVTGRVMLGWPAERGVSLGVLLARDLVLVPLTALDEDAREEPGQPSHSFGLLSASDWIAASVAAIDEALGVAVLRLEASAVPAERLLEIGDAPPEGDGAARTTSIIVAPAGSDARAHLLRPRRRDTVDGVPVLRLSSEEDLKWELGDLVGAPIASEGRLVAIVCSYARKESPTILATEIASVLRGPIGALLGRAPSTAAEAKQSGSAERAGAALTATLAGYVSEQDARRDALDIKSEVNALCSVIAARNVKPPLAIGLFGDWGSGKSFFMDRMERRLDVLAGAADRMFQDGRDDVPFCRKVVQIRFNAWHYMDQNLWASVVQRVFEGLGQAVGGAEAGADAAREALFRELDSTKRLLADAERRLEAASAAAAEATAHALELAGRRARLEGTFAEVNGLIVAEASANAAETAGRMRDALRALGRPASDLAMDGVAEQVREMRALVPRARRAFVWLVERDPDGKRRRLRHTLYWLLPMAGVTSVAAFAAWNPRGWATTAAAALLPLLTGVLARVGAATQAVKGAVERLETAEQQLARIRGEAEARRLHEQKAHDEAQTRLAREEHEARVAREETQRRLAEVLREVEDIKAGRRLYRYIQERARGDDYRRYQGVIALVRDDFQQLSALLRAAAASDEPGDVPPIERIVLYIDDLDRCPEERVVEVLQAVHLILAFDLFVVVVGVDSRWLLHALQSQYAAFLRPANELGMTREEVAHWATSPQNYLEKIFQIPFTLRPMDREGYKRLVGDLVRPLPQPAPVRRRIASGTVRDVGSVSAAADGTDALDAGLSNGAAPDADAREESERRAAERRATDRRAHQASRYDRRADDRRGAARGGDEVEQAHGADDETNAHALDLLASDLELGEQEVEFMLALDRLIPSPRAAKRFVNVYRLFRAAVADAGELPTLVATAVDGEPPYKAVLVLLAMLTGYPSQAPDVFRALERASDGEPWWPFVRRVAGAEIAGFDALVTAEWSTPLAVDNTMWRLLDARLASLERKLGYSGSLVSFRKWAPRVARYSFHSGRVSAWEHGAGRVSVPTPALREPAPRV